MRYFSMNNKYILPKNQSCTHFTYKIVLSLFLTVSSIIATNAQGSYFLGIKVGGNIGAIRTYRLDNASIEINPGINVGIFQELQLSERYSLLGNLEFSSFRGTHPRNEYIYESGPRAIAYLFNDDIHTGRISIPIIFRGYFVPRFWLEGGGAISANIYMTNNMGVSDFDSSQQPQEYSVDLRLLQSKIYDFGGKEFFIQRGGRRFVASAIFGMGYQITNKFAISARAQYDVTTFLRPLEPSYKVAAISLALEYRLFSKKDVLHWAKPEHEEAFYQNQHLHQKTDTAR